jgi:hypothetical protein
MATLDLRAPAITIKFDKGKDLNPIFYYLSPTNSVINLTGYHARMQVRLTYGSTPIWDLDDQTKGGLQIVTGTAQLDDGTLVPGAYGIKLLVTDTQTAALTSDVALLFDIELIDTSTTVLPFIKGILLPSPEVTI